MRLPVVACGLFAGALALSLPSLSAQAFYPDDPYFEPTAPGLYQGFYGQWYLVNQMPVQPGINAGLDINILGAWQAGYTGKGVVIAIIDDGVDSLHPDLSANFRNEYSWSTDKTREENLASANRGTPMLASSAHGTAVAGVAAAVGGNGIGVTGVAAGADYAAINLLEATGASGRTAAQIHVAALLYQGQKGADGQPDMFADPDWSHVPVRVKNLSYGAQMGFITDDFSSDGQDAINEGSKHGVIYVIAVGNARTPDDSGQWKNNFDCGKDLMTSAPSVINVAALGADGKFAPYSNYGSNIFVTAPTQGTGEMATVTTDRRGSEGYNYDLKGEDPYFDESEGSPDDVLDYMSTFDGTSSAAPVVSGVMALGVEANAGLNARLAQHILVRTSRVVDADDSTRVGGWVRNGAGNWYNRNYGFGLIDASAFVFEAAKHGRVSEQTLFNSGEVDVNRSFFDEGPEISYLYTVEIAPGMLQPVEFISVYFLITGLQTDLGAYGTGTGDGTGSIMGDFEAWLTSPDGTRQMLFSDDRLIPPSNTAERSHQENMLEWEFLSYAYWGENPEGDWLLELINTTGNLPSGFWETFEITIGMGEYLIPEPRTIALVLAGACSGLLLLRRRKATGR